MKRISRKTVWRLAPVNLVIAAIVGAGIFVQQPAANGYDAAKYLAIKKAYSLGEALPASLKQRIGRELNNSASSAAADANFDLSGGTGTVPASALPNATNHYYMINDYTYPGGWRELGPRHFPASGRANPITGVLSNVSGRVASFAVDPATCSGGTCNTQYLGTANGGVWKTLNAGFTWTEIFDHQSSEAIGAITIDPVNHNIVWVGTGEQNASGDTWKGSGVFVTSDAGVHWRNVGFDQFVNRSVSDIVIDPATAGTTNATLYVSSFAANTNYAETCCGTRSSPYLPITGFWKTTDGGQTWGFSNPPAAGGDGGGGNTPKSDASGFSGIQDLIRDSTGTLWAGYYKMGLYMSTNNGATWHQETSGLPVNNGFDRVTPVAAPSNANRLYVAFSLSGGKGALYRSDDHGATWALLANAPNRCGSQCVYDQPLAVDPNNPDILYAGGQYGYDYESNPGGSPCQPYPAALPPPFLDGSGSWQCNSALMKSTDGGTTWYDMEFNGSGAPIHPDDHVVVVPQSGTVFTGNDGGLYQSADSGVTWNSLNEGIGTIQDTGGATGPTGFVFVGAQDNGTMRIPNGLTQTATFLLGGDGGPTLADPFNANRAYYSYVGNTFDFRDDAATQTPYPRGQCFYGPGCNTFISAFWGDFAIEGRGRFYGPYVTAYKNPDGSSATNQVFAGTYRIWRDISGTYGGIDGNNDGDGTNDPSDTGNWKPISPDFGTNVTAISVAQNNPNVVVATTQTGAIWMTTNALTTPVVAGASCDSRANGGNYLSCHYVSGPIWTRIDKRGTQTPNRPITSITFAPGSTTRIYVTYSGFSVVDPNGIAGHIFETQNTGATWTNLNGTGTTFSLPDIPGHSIVVNPHNGHLYLAMEFGVFISLNDGAYWQRIDYALPNVDVKKLWMDPGGTQLYANTHGRGVWIQGAP